MTGHVSQEQTGLTMSVSIVDLDPTRVLIARLFPGGRLFAIFRRCVAIENF
jgi:hypothetical protein